MLTYSVSVRQTKKQNQETQKNDHKVLGVLSKKEDHIPKK